MLKHFYPQSLIHDFSVEHRIASNFRRVHAEWLVRS